MHRIKLRAAVLIALAPLTTACSSIFGTSASAGLPEIRVAGAGEQSAVQAGLAIEEGRGHLAAGNPGLAIEAFQRALATGESVGPAANGIGVAYARIGRADLARRYFHQAIAVSPQDSAYLANLDRLESTLSIAVATQVTMRPSIEAPAQDRQIAAPRVAAPQVVRVEPRSGIVRVSRSEVRISTVSPSGRPSTLSANDLERNFQPIVRISLARDNGNMTERPARQVVRITLPSSTAAGSSRAVVTQNRGRPKGNLAVTSPSGSVAIH
jgi:hypothetical protein